MIKKKFDKITSEDVKALLINSVSESRTLDYKLILPGKTDENKTEFLADITAFANSSGGDLVFGVAESNGVPTDIPGLATTDMDETILRLENILRTGVDPRLSGVEMKSVGGFSNGPVLVIRVPRSWSPPHMVVFKNGSKFYARNSAGKYQLDVDEIRAAATSAATLQDSVRQFRIERITHIVSDDTPVKLHSNPKIVLHVLPVSSFSGRSVSLTAADLRDQLCQFLPTSLSSFQKRFNADGFLLYGNLRAPKRTCSYPMI